MRWTSIGVAFLGVKLGSRSTAVVVPRFQALTGNQFESNTMPTVCSSRLFAAFRGGLVPVCTLLVKSSPQHYLTTTSKTIKNSELSGLKETQDMKQLISLIDAEKPGLMDY